MRRVFVCAAMGARLFFAQAANPPAFEVASVKVSQSVGGHTSAHSGSGSVNMSNVTLKFCITRAYRITDPQVLGPSWLDSDRYDIVAKIPVGAPDGQIPEMLQTLLADRFKLAAHRERKELAALALVLGKNGPKFAKVETSESSGMTSSRGNASGQAVTMARFADFLSAPWVNLGLPVVDQTGLNGTYTFTLKWTPEEPSERPERKAAEAADAPPPLFAALQQQLGLKLEKRKVTLDVLVVDRAERVPTEN